MSYIVLVEEVYHSDSEFRKWDASKAAFSQGEYEFCRFIQCTFHAQDLEGSRFIDCIFEECDLSNVSLKGVGLQQVVFKKCKLIGIQFDRCNPFTLAVTFESCTLDYASFYQMRLGGSSFRSSRMRGVDLTEADLTAVDLQNCHLADAHFEQTNLENADLRGAVGYRIDPRENRMKGMKVRRDAMEGLLTPFDIRVED